MPFCGGIFPHRQKEKPSRICEKSGTVSKPNAGSEPAYLEDAVLEVVSTRKERGLYFFKTVLLSE